MAESLCQTAPPVFDCQGLGDAATTAKASDSVRQCDLDLRKDQSRLNPLNLEIMDRKPVSVAEFDARFDVSNTDPEKGEKCVTEDSNRTRRVPSLQELEEVLHSAPRSCRHGDEVWPNLYLGDM